MTDQKNIGPPRWADRFLEWYCHSKHLDILRGDLYELYDDRLENGMSKFKADLFFCLEVFTLCRPFAFKKLNNENANTIAMWRNYFKITYRNLFRQKVYSFLN
ncbi:MAG: permease prefix domain 2-containing transporter, partial [Bacteroidota bacterium]